MSLIIKTTPQVAKELGISETTLLKYAKRLSVRKVGQALAWTPRQIEQAKFMRYAALKRRGKKAVSDG